MTGYGRGRAEADGRRVEVEIRSVNHRYLDIKLRGANLDGSIEEQLSSSVRSRLARGSIAVTVRVVGASAEPAITVDMDRARQVHRQLSELVEALDLTGGVTVDLVCGQPGVLVATEPDRDTEKVAAAILAAAAMALDDLIAMRESEGASLAVDIDQRMATLLELAAGLDQRSGDAPAEAQRRLRDRVGKLLATGQMTVDDQRIAQEIALIADRMDVTEELVRVRSHIAQVEDLLKQEGAVGRKLDFLIQELGREFNTIASKSQSAEIAQLVVEAKAELEKVREQVQNIE